MREDIKAYIEWFDESTKLNIERLAEETDGIICESKAIANMSKKYTEGTQSPLDLLWRARQRVDSIKWFVEHIEKNLNRVEKNLSTIETVKSVVKYMEEKEEDQK